MQTAPDWAGLWKQLVGLNDRWREVGPPQGDRWEEKARSFSRGIQNRWSHPDSSRELLTALLLASPDATLLDIGAGTGAWTVLAARLAASVTAVEPSPAMLAVLRENLAAAQVSNVEIIQGSWPEVEVAPHDFSWCSHAMYGARDLPGFIRKMVNVTQRTCFLLMRAPKLDGLMAELARLVLGHPYDSPNFIIAYNILAEMGVYANVIFEDTGLRKGWSDDSLEAALAKVKRRLGLVGETAYDASIYHRLEEELICEDGVYVWPRDTRSALVYWDVGGSSPRS